jgi:DNA-binding response OmpR family regulator
MDEQGAVEGQLNEKPVRVAVVDDDPGIVKVISVILKTNGFEVIDALNGIKALAMVKSELPDVVLLDIMMPDVDGFEVCRQLKDDPSTRDIPVIFVSAKTGLDHVEKGKELGAADYIIKPFAPAVLIAKIREVAEGPR